MKVTKEVIGGVQPVIVVGLSATEAGVTIARQGVFKVARGTELSPNEVLASTLAGGIENPQVVDIDHTYYMQITKTDFGGNGSKQSGTANVPIVMSEKRYEAVEGPLTDKQAKEAPIVMSSKKYEAIEGVVPN